MSPPAFSSFADSRNLFDERPIIAFEYLLLTFFLSLALSTLTLRLGVFLQVSFIDWARATVVAIISTILLVVAIDKPFRRASIVTKFDWPDTAIILTLAIAGAILAVAINRPDLDDSVYVPKALYYTENPTQLLNDIDTSIFAGGQPLYSKTYFFYELFLATFSALLGGHFLFYYHIVFPAVVGFLIVVSMFLLASILHPSRKSVLFGVLVFLLIAILLGETHRTYGNFAFARAFQAKGMFLTVGITSWTYFSLKYFILRDRRSLLTLVLMGIGMAGATSTAMVFLPLLALIVFISYLVQEKKDIREIVLCWKLPITYFAALIPVVIMALEFREYAMAYLQSGATVNSAFPKSFNGQLSLMVNPNFPVTILVLAVAALIVILYSRSRRFFLTWFFLAFVFLLNPLVAPLIIKHITTENIYWRLFYLLPFPLIAVIASAIIFQRNYEPSKKHVFVATLVLIAIAGFFGPTSVINKNNRGATFEWARFKIPADVYAATMEILSKSPDGPMLSPLDISSAVLLLTAKRPQIGMREDYMRLLFESNNLTGEYLHRSALLAYLYSGRNADISKAEVIRILSSKDRPVTIVLLFKGGHNGEVIPLLSSSGYSPVKLANHEYLLFTGAG